MNKDQLIELYFNSQGPQIEFWSFYIDLALTALLAFILGRIYIKFSNTLSNKKSFVSNFILLALTTMLIISVVKTSLTLSLGLVGALSIVRFRAAIKEPEELSYLFLAISVGIGFGAGQRYITLLGFAFITVILLLRGMIARKYDDQNLYITLSTNGSDLDMINIVGQLKKNSTFLSLKRYDRNPDRTEMVLCAKFDDMSQLNEAEMSLRALDSNMKISMIDDRGISS